MSDPTPLTEAELKEMERIFQGDRNSYSGCLLGLRLIAEVRRLREALTRYGARHDVDCPMNPESGHQPPLRCTCGLLEMRG